MGAVERRDPPSRCESWPIASATIVWPAPRGRLAQASLTLVEAQIDARTVSELARLAPGFGPRPVDTTRGTVGRNRGADCRI